VSENSLEAKAGSEYLPFSEAFAASGNWETSMKYIQKAYDMDKSIEKLLCSELTRYQLAYASADSPHQALVVERENLACP
jgi:hypothetical protein